MDIDSCASLNNGVLMPYFGLGTYGSGSERQTVDAVLWALESGYRLIDTASLYGNERGIGLALRKAPVPRDEVFVTTKLWNADHGYDRAIRAFHESLERLGLEYIDLYLIHWPEPGLRGESWRALETLYQEGLCRAIGVSNYRVDHLEELLGSCRVVPAVNQVEFSPFLYQKDLLGFCRENGIQLESYSPLTRGRKFDHPTLAEVSRRYGKTPAQVLIRWALEHRVVVIPKSSNRKRIHENADVFDFSISSEDMGLLDSLDEGYRVSWDPTGVD